MYVLLTPHQAQRHAEAAKLLVDAAEQLAGRQAPPLQIKKLYVLAALELEALRKKALAAPAAAGGGSDGSSAAAAANGAARGSVLTGGKQQSAGAAHTLAGEGDLRDNRCRTVWLAKGASCAPALPAAFRFSLLIVPPPQHCLSVMFVCSSAAVQA